MTKERPDNTELESRAGAFPFPPPAKKWLTVDWAQVRLRGAASAPRALPPAASVGCGGGAAGGDRSTLLIFGAVVEGRARNWDE